MIIKRDDFKLIISGLDRLETDLEYTKQMLAIMAFAEAAWIENKLLREKKAVVISYNDYPLLSSMTSLQHLQKELIEFVRDFRGTLLEITSMSPREHIEGSDPDEYLFDPDYTSKKGEAKP